MQNTTPLSDYWAQVREVAATLPPVVHLMSIEQPYNKQHKAGVMCEQVPFYAAQNLIAGSHRQATKDEIKAFEANIVASREKAKQDAIEAKGVHIHVDAQTPATVTVPEPKKGK